MPRKILVVCLCLGFAALRAAATDNSQAHPNLTAAQIVDKNVAARGGLLAWRSVEALSMSGRLDAGGNASRARGKGSSAGRPAAACGAGSTAVCDRFEASSQDAS